VGKGNELRSEGFDAGLAEDFLRDKQVSQGEDHDSDRHIGNQDTKARQVVAHPVEPAELTVPQPRPPGKSAVRIDRRRLGIQPLSIIANT
jgi:hypothetical protein